MKTFKTTLLTIAVLLCSISASAYNFEVDGIYYNIISETDLTVEVKSNNGKYNGVVVIPENVSYSGKTYSVTRIGYGAFKDCSNLMSVTIPNSVTSIGMYAFYGCSSLTSITIPESVTNIYEGAFEYCYSLTNITFPNSVTSIEKSMFSYCSSLTSVTIPNSVTSIGMYAFDGCSSLSSVTIPNSVTSIGEAAFYNCYGLTNITIPNSVTSIGQSAFDGCTRLTAVHITDMEAWCKVGLGDGNSSKPLSYHLYMNGEEIRDFVVPNSITSIGDYTFYGCSGLMSITIPNSVTSIEGHAFAGCTGLTSITIPNSVTSIGNYAFYNCSSLTSVTIPSSVTSIGSSAFCNCSNLLSITLPESVTSIEYQTFNGCSGLMSVTIPNSVTSIGGSAFSGCKGLMDITIPNSVTSIGSYAFNGCSGLTSITVPNSVTSIEYNTFYNCSSLTSVTIPNSVTSIGEHAFYGCSSLTSVTIPNSVTSIGSHAFQNCSRLTSITIPNSVTSIGDYTFCRCTSLTSITIPHSVTIIEENAFYACSKLTNISLGSSLISIRNSAFEGCYNVSEIISYAVEPPLCYSLAFKGIDVSKCTLKILKGCSEAYQSANQWKDFQLMEEYVTKFLLTWKVDDEVVSADSITYGEVVEVMEIPTKEGYTFSGWSEVPATMPSGDLTIRGTFIPNTYTLTYKVDGVEYAKEEVPFGAAITQKEAPTKEGHTFNGWSEVPDHMPANDITIEGKFTVNTYTLTYMVDGEVYATEEVTYGSGISLMDAPTKEGHTFSGWSEIPEMMPAEEVRVVGSFTLNSYSLTYMLDGEVYHRETLFYGNQVNGVEIPQKEGYTFSGWSEIPETMPAEDVMVVGQFTINTYQLTYIVDGDVHATMQIQYGSPLYLIADPTKEGFIFSGWSEIPDTMPANDVTIEGEFTVNAYSLTYMVDGEVYATKDVTYGSAITLMDAPTKEGHTFSGWSEIPDTMPAHDVTIEGKFTINTYTLTYMIDGEEYAKEEVDYGSAITLKDAPVKEGYIFSGWREVPETMPAKDIVVTGTFSVNGIDVVVTNQLVDIYTLQGVMVKQQIPVEDLEKELPSGIYVVNGKKFIIK